MLNNIFLVASGGALGSVIRFLINHFASKGLFPWSTVIVNLGGCILAGILAGLANRIHFPLQLKYLIFTGFLGGFTTFSAFGLDTVLLWIDGQKLIALYNVLFNLSGVVLLFFSYKLSS